MRILSCLAIGLSVASAAWAQEAFQGRGYLTACGEEGCFLNAAGTDLFVPTAAGAQLLHGLPMMAAVDVSGTLSGLGDSSATLSLTAATRVSDDLYEGNLLAMQGEWQPRGAEAPFRIAIYGMEWTEIRNDEPADRFMISVGDSCADGSMHKEMVVNLYRYGDDPAADACWLVDAVEDSVLTLRNASGGDLVVFDRFRAE